MIAVAAPPRRRIFGVAAAVSGSSYPITSLSSRSMPGTPDPALTDFSRVVIPPDVGQSGIQAYTKQTGHSVRGIMLDYWRANGSLSVYGAPISEPFASPSGFYSQAFENGIFEYHPEYQDTHDPVIRMAPIGQTLIQIRVDTYRRDGRRAVGGGDPRSSVWKALSPDTSSAQKAIQQGEIYDENTGHTVTGDFAAWYQAHEGGFYLGAPLSQVFKEAGASWQYFESGVLRRVNGQVGLAPVAAHAASLIGVDLTAIKNDNFPEFSERLFDTASNPFPQGDQDAPGRKWIEVNISQETLRAYQGNTVVMTTLVSTGLPPNNTERGTFHVRMKFPLQTMSGFENGTGEVVGFGDSAQPAGTSFWEVKDVPNVMYVNTDAEAMHGAYWHNNFGRPMSHGCINLPLPVASWMYGWAPLGTMVWVHD
jgi:lipoprotein-anchoring transpeptidase ErfK/SrfK